MTGETRQAALEALLASPSVALAPGTAPLLLDGRLAVEVAFQKGLLRDLDPATCAAWAETRQAPEEAPTRTMEGGTILVSADAAAAFAEAIGAVGDWGAGPDAVAHPMLHTRLLYPLLRALMAETHGGHTPGRVLHGQHDARFLSALRPGDRLTARGELLPPRVGPRATMQTARLRLLRAGEPVVEALSTFLLPAAVGGPRPEPRLPPLAAPDAVRELTIAADQAERYAAASLDTNPIHLDEAAAREAGHPGVILHGLCTLALAGEQVLAELSGRDPRTLSRLAGRFRRPVRPGQRLRLHLWRNALGACFELRDEDDRTVLDQGIAELQRRIR